MTMPIELFKLKSGEEVVARVIESTDLGWWLLKPNKIYRKTEYHPLSYNGAEGPYGLERFIIGARDDEFFLGGDMVHYHVVDVSGEVVSMYLRDIDGDGF